MMWLIWSQVKRDTDLDYTPSTNNRKWFDNEEDARRWAIRFLKKIAKSRFKAWDGWEEDSFDEFWKFAVENGYNEMNRKGSDSSPDGFFVVDVKGLYFRVYYNGEGYHKGVPLLDEDLYMDLLTDHTSEYYDSDHFSSEDEN